ncbi:MAG: DUF4357 domain-containing protein [Candidatus Promineifilaceae bacterium]
MDTAKPTKGSREEAVQQTTKAVQAEVKVLEKLRTSQQDYIDVELQSNGAYATGKYTGFGLEVLARSIGTSTVQTHMKSNRTYWRIRTELETTEVIEVNNTTIRFTQNHTFSSPTSAVQILTGSNWPGPLVWRRITDKKTLKEIIG